MYRNTDGVRENDSLASVRPATNQSALYIHNDVFSSLVPPPSAKHHILDAKLLLESILELWDVKTPDPLCNFTDEEMETQRAEISSPSTHCFCIRSMVAAVTEMLQLEE